MREAAASEKVDGNRLRVGEGVPWEIPKIPVPERGSIFLQGGGVKKKKAGKSITEKAKRREQIISGMVRERVLALGALSLRFSRWEKEAKARKKPFPAGGVTTTTVGDRRVERIAVLRCGEE